MRLLVIDCGDAGWKKKKEKEHEFKRKNRVLSKVSTAKRAVVNKGTMETELENG